MKSTFALSRVNPAKLIAVLAAFACRFFTELADRIRHQTKHGRQMSLAVGCLGVDLAVFVLKQTLFNNLPQINQRRLLPERHLQAHTLCRFDDGLDLHFRDSAPAQFNEHAVTDSMFGHGCGILYHAMLGILSTQTVPPVTEEQVWWRPNDASNSFGNMLLHLNGNVRQWLLASFNKRVDTRNRPAEFNERNHIPTSTLLQQLPTDRAPETRAVELAGHQLTEPAARR